MKYLLDTNICIALVHRPEPDLIKRISKMHPEDFVVCSVVKAEMQYGARNSQRVSSNLSRLESFFAPFESLPFDDRASSFYGINRALLSKAGTPIGGNDLMIASIAQANDATVITRNKSEFSRIPGLKFEVW